MREKAIRFGKTSPLVGVLAEPTVKGSDLPAVLLLNSGILHHVGASRLHVQLARRLANAGYTVLRFDYSGIGDSEARKDTLPFEKSAVLETQEGMDYLTQTRGAKSFVLMGLCSGADMAYKVALADPRVAGVFQMDAFCYRTQGYWMRYYAQRVFSLTTWKNWVARKLNPPRTQDLPQRDTENTETPEYRRKFPPRESVAADLQTLMGRAVQLLYVFSGGQSEHYNHREQYKQSFPEVNFGDRLQVEYVAGADHLFTNLDHQRFVLDTTAAWMSRRWPVPASTATPVAPAADRGVAAGRVATGSSGSIGSGSSTPAGAAAAR